MYRRGVVSAVDEDTMRVRVKFADRGDVESPWLDVIARDAADDDEYGLPSIGAQVGCLLEAHADAGCCIGAIHSKVNAPKGPKKKEVRRLEMKDGFIVEYDRRDDKHTLKIVIPDGGKLDVTVGGNATITTTGDIELKPEGLVKVAGAGDFFALATPTNARLDALENHGATHVHPSALGPTGTPTPPATPGDSVACEKVKSD